MRRLKENESSKLQDESLFILRKVSHTFREISNQDVEETKSFVREAQEARLQGMTVLLT